MLELLLVILLLEIKWSIVSRIRAQSRLRPQMVAADVAFNQSPVDCFASFFKTRKARRGNNLNNMLLTPKLGVYA